MSKDIFGAVNRHYGSEPDTERDEEAVTEEARSIIGRDGRCCVCKVTGHPDLTDDEWEQWADDHAETCTPLRERVRWMRQWMPEDGPFRLIKRTIIDEEVPDVA